MQDEYVVKISAQTSQLKAELESAQQRILELRKAGQNVGRTIEGAVRSTSRTVRAMGSELSAANKEFQRLNVEYNKQVTSVSKVSSKLESLQDLYERQYEAMLRLKDASMLADESFSRVSRVFDMMKGWSSPEAYIAHFEDRIKMLTYDFNVAGKAYRDAFARKDEGAADAAKTKMEQYRLEIEKARSEQMSFIRTYSSLSDAQKNSLNEEGIKSLGKYADEAEQKYLKLQAQLEKTRIKLENLSYEGARAGQNLVGAADNLETAGNSMLSMNDKTSAMVAGMSQGKAAAGAMAVAGNVLAQTFKSLGSAVVSTGKGFANFVKQQAKAASDAMTADKAVKKLTKSLTSFYTLLKTRIRRAIITGVFNTLKEGMAGVARESADFNAKLSALISAWKTMSNQLTAMFAPIIQVLAPVFTFLVNKVREVLDVISQFTAAIAGQDTYLKAVPVAYDYAKSLDDAANSASKATKKQKELNRTILGFDEINKLSDNKNNEDPSKKLYEAKKISTFIKKLVDDIKNIFAKKNWKGLGEGFANLLNNAFVWVKDFFSWENAGKKIKEVITAIGDTINSFVGNLDWLEAGRSIATAINTIIESLRLLATSINFYEIGRGVAEALNGLLDTTDFRNLGTTIAEFINSAWDFACGLVTNFDPAAFGRALSELMSGAVTTLDFATVGRTIGKFVQNFFTTMKTFFGDKQKFVDLGNGISDGLDSFFTEIDGGDIATAINEMIDSIFLTIKTILNNDSWKKKAKEDIVDFISNLDWAGVGAILVTVAAINGVGVSIGKAIVGGIVSYLTGSAAVGAIKDAIGGTVGNATKVATGAKTFFGTAAGKLSAAATGWIAGTKLANRNTKTAWDGAIVANGGEAEWLKARGNVYNVDENGMASIVGRLSEATGKDIETVKSAVKAGNPAKLAPLSNSAYSLFVSAEELYKKVKHFATGGFPAQGQFFLARENGAELVGQIGNRTAVANNDQIVASVANGVRDAVAEVFMAFAQNPNNTTANDNAEIAIYIDSEDVGRMALKGIRNMDKRMSPVLSY